MPKPTVVSAPLALFALLACAPAFTVSVAAAQGLLERPPLLAGGWVGTPGSLAVSTPFRFSRAGRPDADVDVVPTLQVALGLPWNALAGASYSPASPLVPGKPDWEVYGRYRILSRFRGAPLDAAAQVGWSGAARSVDGELSLARWFGALRLLGAARAFSDAFGGGSARGALAAGAVLAPRPRSLPITLSADWGTLLGRRDGEAAVWSAGASLGVPYSVNTLSVFATNTPSGSLQGTSAGGGPTRWGFELTLPVPLGRVLGWYVPRETAARAVVEAPPGASAVRAEIFRHAFPEERIVISAGATITWTNRDDVVHTVTADDRSWDSGAVAPGQSWSATFREPGIYPFHCGPHPYMKGTVIVR